MQLEMAAVQTGQAGSERRAAVFTVLLEPVLARAYAVALGMSGNAADAEDLVQEAALRAFRAFGSFTPGTNFRAWFLCILTNVFRGKHRRAKRSGCEVSFTELGDDVLYGGLLPSDLHRPPRDPGAEAIGRLETEQVLAAFQTLPAPFRTAALLYFVDEFTYPEIAEALGCSLGTVRSRIHRGRRLLQAALRRRCGQDETDRRTAESAPSARRGAMV